jgi:PAS domain S-box-containing protein
VDHGAGGALDPPLNKLREGGIGGVLDRLPVLISYIDAESRFQYANRALLQACGRSLDTPVGTPAREMLGEEIFVRVRPHIARALGGEVATFQDWNDFHGARRHIELTFMPDFDARGVVRGFIGIGYDVTDRVRRESMTFSREQQLTGILHTMAEGMVIHDRDGRLVEANPAAERLLSLTRQQLFDWDVARPHWQTIGEDGLPLSVERLPVLRTLRTGQPVRGQIIGIRIQGQAIRWISVNADPLYNGTDPEPSGVVGTFSDVTAFRESVARIRELVQRMEEVREQERRELALLLHEGLAQDLFSLRLALANLRREWPDAQSLALEEMTRALDRCLADTRQVAGSLRPTGPPDQPIEQIIAEHARYFEGLARIEVRVHHVESPRITAEPIRLLLFRVVQEALTNVARHAKATRVDVFLEQVGVHLQLRVVDDGVGVEPGSFDKVGSLGLLGMRERARLMAGTLQVERNPGGGTTLLLRVPITQDT